MRMIDGSGRACMQYFATVDAACQTTFKRTMFIAYALACKDNMCSSNRNMYLVWTQLLSRRTNWLHHKGAIDTG